MSKTEGKIELEDNKEESSIIGDELKKNFENNEEDRCVGSLLGVMFGDAIGASCEGFSASVILKENPKGVRDFAKCAHMGVEWDTERCGMYTDDTQTSLALATSIVDCGGLNPLLVARSYADFYNTKPIRGYPNTAQAVLRSILLRKVSFLETGTIAINGGSYANGGAMRITPVGISFRNATDLELREAVRMAIVSSHVHPEAIDGAYIQARAVSWLIHEDPKTFDPFEFLRRLEEQCQTEVLKEKMGIIRNLLNQVMDNPDMPNSSILRTLSTEGFQIRTCNALACSFWAFLKRYNEPEEALISAVMLGGDTDTVASLSGACLGALHGTEWIPKRWYSQVENNEKGRDYCVETARELYRLDLHGILGYDETQDMEPKILVSRTSVPFRPVYDD